MSSRPFRLLVLFVVLVVPGAFFGNLVLAAMSLVPLTLMVVGMALSPRRPVAIDFERPALPVWAGDGRRITKRVTLSKGFGSVRLCQPLPPEFELTGGNNLALPFPVMKQSIVELSFQVTLAKRGHYLIPPLQWASEDPLGSAREQGTIGEHLDIVVWPRFYCPRRAKSLPALSVSPFPSADIARIGIPGQDFREIRKYVSGDPVKNINWRATARHAEQSLWPLVNEFEREGRKSVLIYLHASQATEVGNSIRNGLESGIEASTNMLYYYLQRGYRTGIYMCSTPPHYLYPETGRMQFEKALQHLISLRPGNRPVELLTAVETTRDYVLGYNPLAVVVSTIDSRSGPVVEAAVRRLRQMYSLRRRPAVMVIGIDAYGLVPSEFEYESTVPELTRLHTLPTVRRLRSYGANVIEWHPAKQAFWSVFSRSAWVK